MTGPLHERGMNINERRPWLEADKPVPVGGALDRWMAAEELARQVPPDPTVTHKSCVICWHIFDDDEFIYLGTVCGNCLDYGLNGFWKPSAQTALQVADRCLIDVSDLWAEVGSHADEEIVSEVEKRLAGAGRYVGTDGDRWFVYGSLIPREMFESDARGSLHLTDYWSEFHRLVTEGMSPEDASSAMEGRP